MFKNWLGLAQLKTSSVQTKNMLLAAFKIHQPQEKKTFTQAMQHLKLTEYDLVQKITAFRRLTNIYLVISCGIFIYSLYLAYCGAFGGFILGLALTILSLINCFKYSYLRFQIQSKKLGVSLKEWLTGEFQ